MNNENKTQEITADQVSAFLAEQAANLAHAVNCDYAFVGCYVGNPAHGRGVVIEWKTYVADDTHRTARTLAEVMTEAIALASPECRAAAKRVAAVKLLAEADALSAQQVEA